MQREILQKVLNLKIAGDDGIHGFWFKNIHVHPRQIHSSSEKMTRGCKYSVMDDLGEDFSHPNKVSRISSRRAKHFWGPGRRSKHNIYPPQDVLVLIHFFHVFSIPIVLLLFHSFVAFFYILQKLVGKLGFRYCAKVSFCLYCLTLSLYL